MKKGQTFQFANQTATVKSVDNGVITFTTANLRYEGRTVTHTMLVSQFETNYYGFIKL